MNYDEEIGFAFRVLQAKLRAALDSTLTYLLNERAELNALEWLHTHRNDQIAIDEVPFAPR